MKVRMEAMAVQQEADQQRMTALLQYMQAATGVAPPPALFSPPPVVSAPRPPPPPQFSTPVSNPVLVCTFMLTFKPQHYFKPSLHVSHT